MQLLLGFGSLVAAPCTPGGTALLFYKLRRFTQTWISKFNHVTQSLCEDQCFLCSKINFFLTIVVPLGMWSLGFQTPNVEDLELSHSKSMWWRVEVPKMVEFWLMYLSSTSNIDEVKFYISFLWESASGFQYTKEHILWILDANKLKSQTLIWKHARQSSIHTP